MEFLFIFFQSLLWFSLRFYFFGCEEQFRHFSILTQMLSLLKDTDQGWDQFEDFLLIIEWLIVLVEIKNTSSLERCVLIFYQELRIYFLFFDWLSFFLWSSTQSALDAFRVSLVNEIIVISEESVSPASFFISGDRSKVAGCRWR